MAITTEIVATYRRPRQVMRRILSAGVREDRALAVLMGACLLFFVAQWPVNARLAYLNPEVPLDARMGASLMAMLFIRPLLAYGLAALSHLIARVFGGNGSHFAARMVLFWSMLAIGPLMLLNGLVAGFIGSGSTQVVVGLVVLATFFVFWISGLRVAEFEKVGADA